MWQFLRAIKTNIPDKISKLRTRYNILAQIQGAMKLQTIMFDVHIFNSLNCSNPLVGKGLYVKDYISQAFMNQKCESKYLLIKGQTKCELLRGFLSETPQYPQSLIHNFLEHASCQNLG